MPSPHPFPALRRKERAMDDPAEIAAVLNGQTTLYLGLSDGGVPFVLPLFYAWLDGAVYFHCAKAGTKVGILERNPAACFVVSTDQGVVVDENPCDFEARHRTVVGHGTASFVEDEAEKRRALAAIVAKFSDRAFDFPAAALDRTNVVRIDIATLTGKKHGV